MQCLSHIVPSKEPTEFPIINGTEYFFTEAPTASPFSGTLLILVSFIILNTFDILYFIFCLFV